MKIKIFYVLVILFTMNSCGDTTSIYNVVDENVIVSKNLYGSTKTDNYTIIDVKLNSEMLTIKIGASGCSSESWKALLVDEGIVLESFPIQRNIKFSLQNEESCLAYFEKEFTFNITELIKNNTSVSFNLDKWDNYILFE